MEKTATSPKTNWGMIILLVILVPILLLGYKYYSQKIEGNESNPIQTASNNAAQNNAFPLVGDWYYKDNGAELKYVNDKYQFTTPVMTNGILKGQITMTMDWMESVNTMNYEVVKDGKLKIIDPSSQRPTYEMEYSYNAASQTLEIADQGHNLTYTKNR